MSLSGVRSFNLWQLPQISPMRAYGYGVVALVVAEMALRWRMSRGNGEAEYRAERYLELMQGAALLAATFCGLSYESGITLATITLVALGRLYGTIRIAPLIGERGISFSRKPFFDFFYYVVEIAAIAHLFVQALLFNSRHPYIGCMMFGVTTAVSTLESRVFKQLLDAGYLDLHSSYLVNLKIERVVSLFSRLQGIKSAFIVGLVGVIAALGPFKPNLGVPVIVLSIFVWGFIDIVLSSDRRMRLLEQCNMTIGWCAVAKSPSLNNSVRDLLYEVAYSLGLGENVNAPQVTTKVIKAFTLLSSKPAIFQTLFPSYAIFFNATSFGNMIQGAPQCLTPDFLFTHLRSWLFLWKKLWTEFSDEQIEKFLLIPEIKLRLQEEAVGQAEPELQQLTKDIEEKERSCTSQGQARFVELRPLLERLEVVSLAKERGFLEHMPEISEKPIVASLLRLKSQSTQRTKKLVDLEVRLEKLCREAERVSDTLQILRVSDIENILLAVGINPTQHSLAIFYNRLDTLGIKWKGDLIEKGIWHQEGAKNSAEELEKRLIQFIKDKSAPSIDGLLWSYFLGLGRLYPPVV
jgi:hypothetical protein